MLDMLDMLQTINYVHLVLCLVLSSIGWYFKFASHVVLLCAQHSRYVIFVFFVYGGF